MRVSYRDQTPSAKYLRKQDEGSIYCKNMHGKQVIDSKGNEKIGEKTIDIIYDYRMDSYNWHRSIFISCFYNYMRRFSHQPHACI